MTAPPWTTPNDIRAWLARRWERGRILSAVVETDGSFPLRVPLKAPTGPELAARFDDARAWVAALRAMPNVRLEWRRINHRQLGAQDVPSQVWIDTIDDAAAVLRKTRELQRFRALLEETVRALPALVPLVGRRPLDVLDAGDDWTTLLVVAQWMIDNPRPDVYIRQLDLPGVHTKFLEEHRQLLTAIFSTVLPVNAVDGATSPGDFTRRFGFRPKPRLVRFRSLDPALRLTAFDRDGHYLLTAADFGRLPPPDRVFLTENEINFLSFPPARGAIVVFGAGSGLEHFGEASWLASRPVHYWGDIDTHGFWILDQLRAVVPHAQSFLMDRNTLMLHRNYWGTEHAPFRRDLQRLTTVERELFDDLRDNRIASNLRLEQERIRFGQVRATVDATS